MSGQEDFLKRWSRRKREVADEKASESGGEKPDGGVDATSSDVAGERAAGLAKDDAGKTEAPAFDISKLPSIESITAETDIRPFLAAGVPAHLTQAALRKLWVADPKIRDFIEIAENQWDFNTGVIPGFDSSLPENAKELVAQIFRKTKEVVEEVGAEPTRSEAQSADAQSSVSRMPTQINSPENYGSASTESEAPEDVTDQRDIAAHSTGAEQQTDASEDATHNPRPHRHGSALPT